MKPQMFIQSQSCDPAVHKLCIQLASRCTNIIRPLLRHEEVGECLQQMYIAARQTLDTPTTGGPAHNTPAAHTGGTGLARDRQESIEHRPPWPLESAPP